jgi:hypothetical protein
VSEIIYRPHRHDDHMGEPPSRRNVGTIGICDCGEYVRCSPIIIRAELFGYRWSGMSDREIREARKAGRIPEAAT